MQALNKLMMISINVSDMHTAKEFYAEQLGLKVTTDYRQNDDNWWVTLAAPEGGATITLSRSSEVPESVKPGTLAIYFETPDVAAAHKQATEKGLKAGDVHNDLFGPGSHVKFFQLTDPDGNRVHVVQKHDERVPF